MEMFSFVANCEIEHFLLGKVKREMLENNPI